LLSLRLIGGYTFAQRMRSYKTRLPESFWSAKMNEIAHKIQLNKSVKLLESGIAKAPMVIGYFKPVVLFPLGMLASMTPNQLEAVLAHELAHIKRNDYLVNLFQSVLETLFFYHPAIWWISACIREERENACDDIAVEVCGNSLVFAKALASLEQVSMGANSQLAMAFFGKRGSLLNRISRLAGKQKRKINLPEGLIILCLITLTLFSFGFQNKEIDEKEENSNKKESVESTKGDDKLEDFEAISDSTKKQQRQARRAQKKVLEEQIKAVKNIKETARHKKPLVLFGTTHTFPTDSSDVVVYNEESDLWILTKANGDWIELEGDFPSFNLPDSLIPNPRFPEKIELLGMAKLKKFDFPDLPKGKLTENEWEQILLVKKKNTHPMKSLRLIGTTHGFTTDSNKKLLFNEESNFWAIKNEEGNWIELEEKTSNLNGELIDNILPKLSRGKFAIISNDDGNLVVSSMKPKYPTLFSDLDDSMLSKDFKNAEVEMALVTKKMKEQEKEMLELRKKATEKEAELRKLEASLKELNRYEETGNFFRLIRLELVKDKFIKTVNSRLRMSITSNTMMLDGKLYDEKIHKKYWQIVKAHCDGKCEWKDTFKGKITIQH
jgi:predicted transcriptional regulator